ncbi:MAG: type II toxin-antitoxin system Phd/YefM family antitoxin [Thermoleophilaceae bacterium]
MRAIGVRELRQHASRYLREVQGGETIEVTDRGRPVARLVPVSSAGGLEELVADGRLVPAGGDALELGAPLAPVEGQPLPADLLAAARHDER